MGRTLPEIGMTIIDPQLTENNKGFFGVDQNSTVVNAALPGYSMLSQFEGMDGIGFEVLFDLMGQNRPSIIEEKDMGCNEYPHNDLIQAITAEENIGLSYNTSMRSAIQDNTLIVKNIIKISPNPVSNQINITIHSLNNIDLSIDIFNFEGRIVRSILEKTNFQAILAYRKI